MTCCVSSTESPLQFYVNNANSPNVTAYGPGLVYGVANKPATFTIYTEDAAEGGCFNLINEIIKWNIKTSRREKLMKIS